MSQTGDSRPIGVFDSGLGGLTVLKSIMTCLPGENTLYFGDSGRSPYGSKSPETVIKFSLQNTRFLLEQNVKMIVIACNTASSRAYEAIRAFTDIPVIDVVGPSARAAARQTRNGRIGVIGTRGTIDSAVYLRRIQQYAEPNVHIFQQACPLFVSLAEEGWWDQPVTREIARIYLEPLIQNSIDTLVLGCTHYPLLNPVIQSVAGPDVTLIQAGGLIARIIQNTLTDKGILNTGGTSGEHVYYTSDSVEQFIALGSAFLSEPIQRAYRIDIERY